MRLILSFLFIGSLASAQVLKVGVQRAAGSGQVVAPLIPGAVAASPITSGLSLPSITWVERGLLNESDVLDDDYIQGRWIWDTSDFRKFVSHVNDGYGAMTVGSGALSVGGTSSAGFDCLNQALKFDVPSFGLQMTVLQSFGSGTDILSLGVQTVQNDAGSGSGLAAVWDRGAGTLYINETIAGSSASHGSVTIALTPPFDIALTVADRSVVVLIKYPGEEWHQVCRYLTTIDSATDLRVPANLAAMKYISALFVSGSNPSATYKIGRTSWGYLRGFSIVCQTQATWADGTPLQNGGDQFFMGYTQCPSGGAGFSIASAQDNVFALDPIKGTVRSQAKLFTLRGGKIFAEGSGSMTYDPVTQDYIYIIPNWGDIYDGSLPPVYCFMYRRKGFPSGVIILDNPITLQLSSTTPAAHAGYDPDLRYDSSDKLWHITYIQTDSVHYGPVTETSPDLVTWTLVRADPLTGQSEGAKFVNVGGTRYIVSSSLTGIKVFDYSLNFIGVSSKPASLQVNSDNQPHPTVGVYRDGPYERVFWLCFDNTRTDGGLDFTWGKVHLMESTAKQTGHDFPLLPLPL